MTPSVQNQASHVLLSRIDFMHGATVQMASAFVVGDKGTAVCI
jgi:hypothetical protein